VPGQLPSEAAIAKVLGCAWQRCSAQSAGPAMSVKAIEGRETSMSGAGVTSTRYGVSLSDRGAPRGAISRSGSLNVTEVA
jgi:hypothetical protein